MDSASQVHAGPTTLSRSTTLPDVRNVRFWGTTCLVFVVTTWIASFALGFQVALGVITVAGFCAAIAGFYWPAIGLFGISTLCVLNPLTTRLLFTNDLLRWNSLNYWLVVVIVASVPLLARVSDVHSRLLQLLVVLLCAQIAISSDPLNGVQYVLDIAAYFGILVYFARATVRSTQWYWWGVFLGTLATCGSVALVLQREHLPWINPNIWTHLPLGAMFSMCLASHAVGTQWRRQLVLQLLAISCFVSIFLSGSRGAMLIGAVSLVYLLTKTYRVRQGLLILGLAMSLALVLAGNFTELQTHSVSRVHKLLDRDLSLRVRTSGRSGLALGAWYIFLDHPLGSGTGSFTTYWDELEPHEGLTGYSHFKHKAAHSAWARALAENGIVGIVILVAYVLSFAVVGWCRRADATLALGLLVSTTLSVAYLWSELNAKVLWMLAAGATVVLHADRFRTCTVAAPPYPSRPTVNGIV
jgi:hypothetical protein